MSTEIKFKEITNFDNEPVLMITCEHEQMCVDVPHHPPFCIPIHLHHQTCTTLADYLPL